jgi:hypothetical protein
MCIYRPYTRAKITALVETYAIATELLGLTGANANQEVHTHVFRCSTLEKVFGYNADDFEHSVTYAELLLRHGTGYRLRRSPIHSQELLDPSYSSVSQASQRLVPTGEHTVLHHAIAAAALAFLSDAPIAAVLKRLIIAVRDSEALRMANQDRPTKALESHALPDGRDEWNDSDPDSDQEQREQQRQRRHSFS